MQHLLKRWTDTLLGWLGAAPHADDGWDRWVAFLLVVAAAVAFDLLLRLATVRGVRLLVARTRAAWDDLLFSVPVLKRGCHILSAVLLTVVLPVVFEERSAGRTVVLRLMQVYLIFCVFRFVSAVLYAAFRIAAARPAWQNKPIKGLRQTAQGLAGIVCGILAISILLGKSPTILLTGLGASAAVLMLIFRDSILGFVSGIQLSANDMLKVGDWISVPKYGADGAVEEVSLTTVKIRNWDNTLSMLPPYLLTTDSFVNWHAMQLSGGRRVMRSVAIDMTSVRFCTPELLERLRSVALLRGFIERTEQQYAADNAARGLGPDAGPLDAQRLTNLGLLRAYLTSYLQNEVPVNRSMKLMVRQLQPTEAGIPLQLYFFTQTVVWTEYERIQADVFDHVLAVIPAFELRVFQNPTGPDIRALGTPQAADPPQSVPQNPAPQAAPESQQTASQSAPEHSAPSSALQSTPQPVPEHPAEPAPAGSRNA